ncbi:MAG: hypothetical protein GY795_07225 [Desulfobacterales bacterium]|nr:hypothetical protein [Desulfobacterales bacterium]
MSQKYEYKIIREEIIPGSLEDFRGLMHEIHELKPFFREDSIFLPKECTPSDYPKNRGRWQIALGNTLQRRGFIFARQLPDGTTELQFAYSSKFQPIGPVFETEFVDYIVERNGVQDGYQHTQDAKGSQGPVQAERIGRLEQHFNTPIPRIISIPLWMIALVTVSGYDFKSIASFISFSFAFSPGILKGIAIAIIINTGLLAFMGKVSFGIGIMISLGIGLTYAFI